MADSDPSSGTALRTRGQDAKRRVFLDEAMLIVDQDGLDALTIKRLSDRLGCSVGALYRHFESKDALVTAMQADAIGLLADAHDRGAAELRRRLGDLTEEELSLATLIAFGSMVAAARDLYPSAFRLQQQLLWAAPLGFDASTVGTVVPVATAMVARPASQLEKAQHEGWLHEGAAFPRAVTWLAALAGVLQLDGIRHPEVEVFDVDRLVHRLTLDLLAGWGADHHALQRAAATVTPEVARDVLATTVTPDEETPT